MHCGSQVRRSGGKPLSTKSARSIFPVVFVDVSPKAGRPPAALPPLPPPSEEGRLTIPMQIVDPEDQALQAAAQWADPASKPESLIKSWYYPSDAFDPWPERTELRCWHCTHPFVNTPFPLPWSRLPKEKKWRVRGFFCGPSCAKAYALERDTTGRGLVMSWIDEIARDFYGYTRKDHPVIPIAPKRELLREYCGSKGWTIDQFRKLCSQGRSITIHRPGFITVKQVIEAEQRTAKEFQKIKGGVSHLESPDHIITTKELTQTKRQIFAGKGARRIGEFIK